MSSSSPIPIKYSRIVSQNFPDYRFHWQYEKTTSKSDWDELWIIGGQM